MKYNKLRDIVVGCEIFSAHGGFEACTEHDVFYAGQAHNEALTPDEVTRLYAANWSIDSSLCEGCAVEGEPSHADEDFKGARHLFTCSAWRIFT